MGRCTIGGGLAFFLALVLLPTTRTLQLQPLPCTPAFVLGRIWARDPRGLAGRRVTSARAGRQAGLLVPLCSLSSDAFGMRPRDMKEVLEELRRESEEQKRTTLQLLSDRLAPPRDDVKDWYQVNWVGNIDRHQSKLFWNLMVMLCNKLTMPFLYMRMLHDTIVAAQIKSRQVAWQTQHKIIPALAKLAVSCVRSCLSAVKEASITATTVGVLAGTGGYKVALGTGAGISKAIELTQRRRERMIGVDRSRAHRRRRREHARARSHQDLTAPASMMYAEDVFSAVDDEQHLRAEAAGGHRLSNGDEEWEGEGGTALKEWTSKVLEFLRSVNFVLL